MAKYFEQKKGTTQSIFVDENGRLHSALPATPKNVELRLETPKNLKNWATMTFVFPHADIDCDASSKAAPINDAIVNLIRHNLAVCDHDERSLKKTGDTYSVSIGLSPRSKPEDLEAYRIKFAEFFVKRIYADHKADFKPAPTQPTQPAQQQQNPQPAQQQQNPQPAQQQQQNPQPAQQQNQQPAQQQQQNQQPAQQQNPQPAQQQQQNQQPAQQQNPQPAQQQQNQQPAQQQQQNPQPAQPAPERLKPGCNPTGMLLTQLSQKASVDEHNRIRRLCGMPERQFILDDGTVYPPTI